jgi:cardiolipin synthase
LTRFEGPIAADVDGHFRDRWLLDGGSDLPHPSPREPSAKPRGRPVRDARVLYNEPNEETNQIRAAYVKHIAEARREIFIENPYLYHPEIASALVDAKKARPSLEVTLVVPAREHNDNLFGQDAQEFNYLAWLDAGIHVFEYQHHFTHLKGAVFDRRWSIHGSTNLNYRSLEDDKDFELVVLVDDEDFAAEVLEQTRDVDVKYSKRIERGELFGTFEAWRKRVRDPRTLALMSRRML